MTVEGRDIAEEALGEELAAAGEYGIEGICEMCGRKRSMHVIINTDQLEVVWAQGIIATICAHVNCDEVAVWVTRDGSEEDKFDPCDEDFMKDISS